MYAEIITVTENSARLAFATGRAGFVSLKLDGRDEIRSAETADCGRLEISGLNAGTGYKGVFCAGGKTVPVSFRTLPAPEGAELDRMLLSADWHISEKRENRKGRFFVESAMLAGEALESAAALGVGAVVLPGDLTNAGTPGEYGIAVRVLKSAAVPVFAVPGNHDYPGRGAWRQLIGPRTFRAELPGGPLIGVDTADGRLLPEDAGAIESELDRAGRVTVVSHYQFFASPDVDHAKKLEIENAAEFPRLFEKLGASPSTIWCGHQNICARTEFGRTLQLNLPQVPQWPCGSVLVRRFVNGTFYTFVPIKSEVLRQWSRLAGAAAAAFYHEPQWNPEYRFAAFSRCNFFQPANGRAK